MPLQESCLRIGAEHMYDRGAPDRPSYVCQFPVYFPENFRYADQLVCCELFRDHIYNANEFVSNGNRLALGTEAIMVVEEDVQRYDVVCRLFLGPPEDIRSLERRMIDGAAFHVINPRGTIHLPNPGMGGFMQQLRQRFGRENIRERDRGYRTGGYVNEPRPNDARLNLMQVDLSAVPDSTVTFQVFDDPDDLDRNRRASFADLGGEIPEPDKPAEPIPEPEPRKTIIRSLEVKAIAPPPTTDAPKRRMRLKGDQ